MDNCHHLASLVGEPTVKTALVRALCGSMTLTDTLSLPIDGVFVNESPLLELLESWRGEGFGRAQWLLGCFHYSVGL